jgi:hypothetical protein
LISQRDGKDADADNDAGFMDDSGTERKISQEPNQQTIDQVANQHVLDQSLDKTAPLND